MRIFNGTNSSLDIPLNGSLRIQVGPKSVSGDFLPSNEFLSLIVTGYDYSELAIIVSGPYEINMCSSVSGAVGYVVQSLEEAIERFTPKTAQKVEVEPTKVTVVEAPIEEPKEEKKEEEIIKEEVEVENPVVAPESVVESIEAEEEVAGEEPASEENVETPSESGTPGQENKPNYPKKNKNKNRKH